MTYDEELAPTGTLTYAKIIEFVNQNWDDDSDKQNDDDHTDSANWKPNKGARAIIDTLRTYIERCMYVLWRTWSPISLHESIRYKK